MDLPLDWCNAFCSDERASGIPGVSSTGSEKCRDMMEKVKIVQKQNNGRGIVFATGTPVYNETDYVEIPMSFLFLPKDQLL